MKVSKVKTPKKTKTNTTNNIQKQKSESKPKYEIYKILTQYLFTGKPELLQELCKNKEDAKKLRYRVVSYFLSIPKLAWYINKYLNNLYDFNKFTDAQWFQTFYDIIRMSGTTEHHHLYFPKFKVSEIAQFYKTIRDFYEISGDEKPSNAELGALLQLYRTGIITEDTLYNLKMTIDGKEPTTKRPPQVFGNVAKKEITNTNTSTKNKTFEDLSPDIKQLCTQAINYKKTRKGCYGCELRSAPIVTIDTNLTTPGPVDILFIGLNPGKEEVEKGIPFIGGAGQIFRGYLDKMIESLNVKYAILNCILCSTNNEAAITNPTQCVKNCAEFVSILKGQFPAKYTVLMGDKAMKSVGVKGGITKLNGTMVDGYFILLHPSAVQYNSNNRSKLDTAFAALTELVATGVAKEQQSISCTNLEYSISPDKIISRIDENHTLLDIRILGERVIFIVKDVNGKKKYYFEDVRVPIYIKSGQYHECPAISSSVDTMIVLSAEEKDKLSKSLRMNMYKWNNGETGD